MPNNQPSKQTKAEAKRIKQKKLTNDELSSIINKFLDNGNQRQKYSEDNQQLLERTSNEYNDMNMEAIKKIVIDKYKENEKFYTTNKGIYYKEQLDKFKETSIKIYAGLIILNDINIKLSNDYSPPNMQIHRALQTLLQDQERYEENKSRGLSITRWYILEPHYQSMVDLINIIIKPEKKLEKNKDVKQKYFLKSNFYRGKYIKYENAESNMPSLNFYRDKYIKYKNKYLQLKNFFIT